jgi:hypothetical protein
VVGIPTLFGLMFLLLSANGNEQQSNNDGAVAGKAIYRLLPDVR